jgi:glycerol-3-phosphate dehydrogenase
VTAGKGVMIAMNTRLVNTVINRLKPPSDGDILVPVGTVSVIGTTDTAVPSPDKYTIEDWEVELLMNEGEQLIPEFKKFRALRAWAGVRPLYDKDAAKDSRVMTRAHTLIDHSERDHVHGLLSMVGGKFTTFRLMAEQLVDKACEQLNTKRSCVTATNVLEPRGTKLHALPKRLAKLEKLSSATYQVSRDVTPDTLVHDTLVCECELVTRAQIEAELKESGSPILNDLRRDLRLGMGPCQSGFCAYRATGIVQETLKLDATKSNAQLLQFLQERWKGERPVMWGQSLRSLELNLNIYKNILGVDGLQTDQEVEVYPTERTS